MNRIPKKGAELNLSTSGTGIPCNDKRAHARVVSRLLIVPLQKITSFLVGTPSESFKYVLNEESQIYITGCNIVKIHQFRSFDRDFVFPILFLCLDVKY